MAVFIPQFFFFEAALNYSPEETVKKKYTELVRLKRMKNVELK